MVAVPTNNAFTSPVMALMEATVGLLLLHEPPAEVDEKFAVAPKHKFWLPLSVPAEGGVVTVIVRVATASGHPPEPVTIYLMIAVPADTAVTRPEVSTVATAEVLLLHDPPITLDENCPVVPAHRFWLPLSVPADKVAVTFTMRVALAFAQPPVPGTE